MLHVIQLTYSLNILTNAFIRPLGKVRLSEVYRMKSEEKQQ